MGTSVLRSGRHRISPSFLNWQEMCAIAYILPVAMFSLLSVSEVNFRQHCARQGKVDEG